MVVGTGILSQTEPVGSMVSSEAEGTQRAAEVRPFVIDVPDSELSDLNRRLTGCRATQLQRVQLAKVDVRMGYAEATSAISKNWLIIGGISLIGVIRSANSTCFHSLRRK